MSISLKSSTLIGIEGVIVNIEVDISKGLPSFTLVGLADTSVREAKERVRAAILNSGYEFPLGRITVNLAPGNLRKVGTGFDLPIALAILIESGQIQREILSDPRKRRQYMEQQEKKKYLEDISKKVRKEMHLYG